jgi:hypothetical protein
MRVCECVCGGGGYVPHLIGFPLSEPVFTKYCTYLRASIMTTDTSQWSKLQIPLLITVHQELSIV